MICAARTAVRSYSFVQLHGFDRAAAMDVGAELVALRGATHRPDHAVADDECTDVATLRLGDELLDQHVLFRRLERLDDRLRRRFVSGARITPMPCVPSSNLITTGAPPTSSIACSTSALSRTNDVAGIPMAWRLRICVARNLSRELAMPLAVFGVYTSICSN